MVKITSIGIASKSISKAPSMTSIKKREDGSLLFFKSIESAIPKDYSFKYFTIKTKAKMSILNQNSKLTALICLGTQDDLNTYSKSIHKAIDFYLCRDPFRPINQKEAGNIYFLKWLDKCLAFELSEGKKHRGKIICKLPVDDFSLFEAFIDSLESVMEDLVIQLRPKDGIKGFARHIANLQKISRSLTQNSVPALN